MSTFLGEKESRVIHSISDLHSYFGSHAKPCEKALVGIEAEFFGIEKATGKALPYDGAPGIHQILEALSQIYGHEPIRENGNIIALKREAGMVTLEPGGQVELSAPPANNVFEVDQQIQSFLNELREVRNRFPNIEWLATGIQPFSQLHEISWVPKERYKIMAKYLGARGSLSHHMMKRTGTNQINYDYLDEQDAMASLRVVLAITSIVSALFANSSFSSGKPNGYQTKRLHIWNNTDPDRTGLLIDFVQEGRTFDDYLNYILTMPMMFIVREGQWIPIQGMSFKQYIESGYQSEKATLEDFELHLSGAFPEARFKNYLEVRGIDGQCPELIPAAAAFWKGILYDPDTRSKAWDLVSFATAEQRLELHNSVPQLGLEAKLGDQPIFPIAEELINLSCKSLAKQNQARTEYDECVFLDRIREKILAPGQSPSQRLLEAWENELERNPARLIEYLSIG